MKISKRITFGLFGLVLFLSACTKFLEVDRPDNLVKDNFWQNREQVKSSLNGLYTSLNSCVALFHAWGDSRSSLYAPGVGDDFTSQRREFLYHDIYPANNLLSWENVYESIGWTNAFIKNAPTALENDPTFSPAELNNMLGEAHALRALTYFYLVRSFKEVPILKEPYESDTQNFNIAASSEADVLDFIEEDLTIALNAAPDTYPNFNERYGRITKNAVRALWADVKLWRNEYAACITLCEAIDASYSSSLVAPESWYSIFNPGNSSESIFELQYTQQGITSPLYSTFAYHDNGREIYLANRTNILENGSLIYPITSTTNPKHFSADTIRLKEYSAFSLSQISAATEVYKYLGEAAYQRSYRRQDNRTANYIFYRYREVMLMKAEAYGMLQQYDEAEKIISKIRKHCDIPELLPGEAGQGAEFFTRLLMEREFELGFEGKEWFAAVRISRREGFQNILVEKGAYNNSVRLPYQVVRARLLDKEGWFLPYFKTELERNPLLKQKDYYKNK